MDIKQNLIWELRGRLSQLEEEAVPQENMEKIREDFRHLETLDLERARYVVTLAPMNKKKHEVTTNYTGSFDDAISKAKEHFRKIYQGTELPHFCTVVIKLKNGSYEVPRRFWRSLN